MTIWKLLIVITVVLVIVLARQVLIASGARDGELRIHTNSGLPGL